MTFMQDILEHNQKIWDKCVQTPFVQELQTGVLSLEKFKTYMIQDSIYLKYYARIYGKAIYEAETLREIQLYYSILGFVNDTESAVRLNYLKQFGMTDKEIEHRKPLPETKRYVDFMFDAAEHGKVQHILMAVLPCMLSYSYIFQKIEKAAAPSFYSPFILEYANGEYAKSCKKWCEFAQEKCGGFNPAEKEKLASIFETASYMELDFWKMAYKNEK